MEPWMTSNWLSNPGWLWTHRNHPPASASLRAGTKGVHHHASSPSPIPQALNLTGSFVYWQYTEWGQMWVRAGTTELRKLRQEDCELGDLSELHSELLSPNNNHYKNEDNKYISCFGWVSQAIFWNLSQNDENPLGWDRDNNEQCEIWTHVYVTTWLRTGCNLYTETKTQDRSLWYQQSLMRLKLKPCPYRHSIWREHRH